MSSKKDMRMRIRAMPWRDGLATAGQQTSIPETSLWQAKNVTAGLDGLMSKRPGIEQWGQTLKVPDGSTSYEYLQDTDNNDPIIYFGNLLDSWIYCG